MSAIQADHPLENQVSVPGVDDHLVVGLLAAASQSEEYLLGVVARMVSLTDVLEDLADHGVVFAFLVPVLVFLVKPMVEVDVVQVGTVRGEDAYHVTRLIAVDHHEGLCQFHAPKLHCVGVLLKLRCVALKHTLQLIGRHARIE